MTRDTFKAKGTPPCELCESLANTNAGSENRGEVAEIRWTIGSRVFGRPSAMDALEFADANLYPDSSADARFPNMENLRNLFNDHPPQEVLKDALLPQAQAGAGDAITDERVDRALLAFHGEGGNFHHIQWTADQRRSMRAALEASHASE